MKADKSFKSRMDGMWCALRIVEEAQKDGSDPLEALKKEIRFRQSNSMCPVPTAKELDDMIVKAKYMCIDTITIIAVAAIHDEFDFGRQRCERLVRRIERKAEDLAEGIVTWDDYIEQLNKELGFELRLRRND